MLKLLITAIFLFPVLCRAESNYLCRSDEQVVFGCKAGAKMISVCASVPFTPTSGYVQYRFGTLSKLELEYPEKQEPPKDHFWLSTAMYSGGGEARIRFQNQGYQYTVFDRTVRTGFGGGPNNPKFSAGVGVIAQGQKNKTKGCSDNGSVRSVAYENLDREDFDDDYNP